MTYSATKYKDLRSKEVPVKIALALADDASALIQKAAAVPDLAGGATLPQTVTKVNELLAALRAAGLLTP